MKTKSIINEEKRTSTDILSTAKKRGGSKPGHSNRAHGLKDTFWNRIRVNANITQKEVADYLHCSKALAGFYFTGTQVPSEEHMDKLCELFSVDRIQGEREFRKAHREWDTIHDGKQHPCFSADVEVEKKAKTKAKKEETPMVEEVKKNEAPVIKTVEKRSVIIKHEEEKPKLDLRGLNRMAFDIMDYDDFVAFTKLLNASKTYERESDWMSEVDEYICSRAYGKVSREQYDKIRKFFG